MKAPYRFYNSVWVGVLAAALLSGCVTRLPVTAFDDPASHHRANSRAVVVSPATPTLEGSPAQSQAASPKLKPDPPPLPLDSNRLIGLDEKGARRLLGTPDYIFPQQTARRWRYINETCILELFFYIDLGTDQLRVLAYDVASSKPAPEDEALTGCAAAIQAS